MGSAGSTETELGLRTEAGTTRTDGGRRPEADRSFGGRMRPR